MDVDVAILNAVGFTAFVRAAVEGWTGGPGRLCAVLSGCRVDEIIGSAVGQWVFCVVAVDEIRGAKFVLLFVFIAEK